MYLRHSYPVVVKDVDSLKVILRFFKCMESMARDMRHPYIPSTTVLGDTMFIKLVCTHKTVNYAKPSAKFLDAGELHQAFAQVLAIIHKQMKNPVVRPSETPSSYR